MTSRQKKRVNHDFVAERQAQRLSMRSSVVVDAGQASRLCSWMTIMVWKVASCSISALPLERVFDNQYEHITVGL
jgi:hypothetical protein